MALTKAQISLVTVATLGAAPGGFTADLANFGSQKEVANLIATLGTPEFTTMTNAEFVNNVAKNLGTTVDAKEKIAFLKALEDGATRADAAVDFANEQLVKHGSIPNVDTAAKSTSTSTDLAELVKVVTPVTPVTPDTPDLTVDLKTTSSNIGKKEIDAGTPKKSADYTFELKNQIGENVQYNGMFLSPVLDRKAADTTGSQIVLELRNLREADTSEEPLKGLKVDGLAFTLNGKILKVASADINAALTYEELRTAIEARVAELVEGDPAKMPTGSDGESANPADYAALATFSVTLGGDFDVTNDSGNSVIGKQIVLTDSAGQDITPLTTTDAPGLVVSDGFTLYGQLKNKPADTVAKSISTNLDADNVGYGSQGASVNIAGQSASDKGVEEIKVTATNGVWFTKLESRKDTDHLARIELQGGSNGYFNVGKQKGNSVVGVGEKGLFEQNFNTGGLKDVQQVLAGAAGSTAINSFVSSNVLGRYEFEDTGIYTADDSKAAITYNLSSGTDVLNLAIDTKVLAAVDTQVNVNTGAGNDVITVAAVNEGIFGGTVQAAITGGSWLINQQLNDNIKIDAGAGNDWILTPGAGNATILAGAGNDVVRVDNTGDRGVFVFNNATTDISILSQGLTSNSDNGLSSGANGIDQTFDFFKAVVKVTFKGFESKYITIDSTNYTTNTKQINQAIKKAVNDDPVLSKLIWAVDNDGNALAIESLIDGVLDLTDLAIEIQGPAEYSTDETAIKDAKDAGQVMLAKGEADKADAVYLADGKSSTTDSIDTTAAQTLYATEFATLPGSSIPATPGNGATASLDTSGFDFAKAITVTIGGTEVLASAIYTDADALATAIQALDNVTTAADDGSGTIAIQFEPTANGAANPAIAVEAENGGSVVVANDTGAAGTTGTPADVTTPATAGAGATASLDTSGFDFANAITVKIGGTEVLASATYTDADALATAIEALGNVTTATNTTGTIAIQFEPTANGAANPAIAVEAENSGSVVVANDTGTAGTTGTPADVSTATPGAGATASLDTSGLDFANAITVTIGGTEVLASATYTDADALATAIQALGNVTTATNTTGTIAIQFEPTANGAANPAIAVEAEDTNGGSATSAGTDGTAGTPAVATPGAGATASLDTSTFDFAEAITVTIGGTEVLASATYTDADALATAIQALGNVTTAANTTGTIAIQFEPTADGGANPAIAVEAENEGGSVVANDTGTDGTDGTAAVTTPATAGDGATASLDTSGFDFANAITVTIGGTEVLASATYTDANALATAIAGLGNVTTAANTTGTIAIQFEPTADGAANPAIAVEAENGGSVVVANDPGADGTTGTAGTAIDYDGANSWAESDNVIDLGAGQDVLVLGTGAQSNDTVVFKNYNLGEKTIVNFTTGTGTGADLLDFTSYLNSVNDDKAVIANTVASDFSTVNGVTLVNFTAGTNTVDSTATTVKHLTFDELTEANVKLLLNNADAAGEINGVGGLSATEANNNVLMVQSNTNAGEYKAFHVTTGATSATADVKLIGTFDFGDTDISGLTLV